MADAIKGLPEGVEVVRIGLAGEDDYELVGDKISKGRRMGAASGVIVKPLEGYSFRFNILDLNYIAVKTFAPLNIKATASFTVTDSYDKQTVDSYLKRISDIPGFVDLKVE